MDGILIVDKPVGLTSHDVVARVRRMLKIKRVGHTGTLDPFATGVLVVLVGQATRLAQFLSDAEKEYEALIRFGYATTTGDITGSSKFRVPSSKLKLFLDLELETALVALTGEIEQVPPMYSAKKVKGEKLYELARRGIEIERKPVRVTVKEFEILQLDNENLSSFGQSHQIMQDDKTFDLPVRVVCSAGTYIRTLAERVGEILGTGAHLAALRRTRAGEMKIENALDLDDLQNLAETNDIASKLISMDAALSKMPFVHLNAENARRVRHGAAVKIENESFTSENLIDKVKLRVRDEYGRLIAVGEYAHEQRQVQPRVLLVAQDE